MTRYVIASVLTAGALLWAMHERDSRLKTEGELRIAHEAVERADSVRDATERAREDSMRVYQQRQTVLLAEKDTAVEQARRARARGAAAARETEALRAAVNRAAARLLAVSGDSLQVEEQLRALLQAHVTEVDEWRLAYSGSEESNDRLTEALAIADSVVVGLRAQLAVTEAARIAERERGEALAEEVRLLREARPGFFERAVWEIGAPVLAFLLGYAL